MNEDPRLPANRMDQQRVFHAFACSLIKVYVVFECM
jgi:hypothetical protein